jgi:hypothetical protein
MSRWWVDLLARVSDHVPLPVLILLSLLGAGVVGLLWYFFPRWVPRRGRGGRWQWPRLRWPRWRRRLVPAEASDPTGADRDDEANLPDVPVEVFLSLADRFAAEGRYAEAVRERLRAIVRGLVERGVVEHRPGATITELAATAATVRPAVGPPLGEAAGIFSDIWYGLRPAGPEHDARMRALTTQVAEAVAELLGSRS